MKHYRIFSYILIGYLCLTCQPAYDDFLDWELQELNGTPFSLDSLEGELLFINLWATWCGPCIQEFPDIQALQTELGPKKLSVVAISDEPLEKLRQFAEEHPSLNIHFIHRILRKSEKEQASFPRSFIYNAGRQLVFQQTGSLDWDSEEIISRFRSW